VEPYGDTVLIADGPDAFIAACERALDAPNAERGARVERMRRVLSETSWDATAAAMDALISRRIGAQAVEQRVAVPSVRRVA
jgi:UDP-galactopyranose mutase